MEERNIIEIEINEMDSMEIEIPRELSPYAIRSLYEKMSKAEKMITKEKGNLEAVNRTPERLKAEYWKDKEEGIKLLKIWEEKGREETVKEIERTREWKLSDIEISRISGLIGMFRVKYGKEEK